MLDAQDGTYRKYRRSPQGAATNPDFYTTPRDTTDATAFAARQQSLL